MYKINKKTKSLMQARRGKNIFVFLMLLYPLAHLVMFYFIVNANSIILAFQKFKLEDGKIIADFVGLDNLNTAFSRLKNDSVLVKSFTNSLSLFFFGLLIGLPLNLVFSFFFVKKLPMSGFFRVILCLPSIIPSIIMSLVFKMLLDQPMLEIMRVLGMTPTNLLTNPQNAFGTIVFYGIWTGFTTGVILYTSAMAKIPQELTEYCQLEGVSRTRELIQIVIPLIWPTMTTMLVLSTAGIFTNIGPVYAMFGDAADRQIFTMGYYLLITVIGRSSSIASYPEAAAVGILLTIVAVPFTLLIKFIMEKFYQDVTY